MVIFIENLFFLKGYSTLSSNDETVMELRQRLNEAFNKIDELQREIKNIKEPKLGRKKPGGEEEDISLGEGSYGKGLDLIDF